MLKKSIIFNCLTLIFTISLTGCGGNSSLPLPAENQTVYKETMDDYYLQPGDNLEIKFFYNSELNENVTIRPDGKISLQLIDEIQAAGLTPAQLDEILTSKYSGQLKQTVITVILKSFGGQRIYVGGEVNRPGLVSLPPGMTTLQAIFQSGGFLETAEPAETLVIRKGPGSKPVPLRIDLAAVMEAENAEADLQLQPDDIVFVPKSAIANANKFIDEYIGGLLMFRGWSFGVSQNLGIGQLK